jgi:two-component system sensor histidine kinase KdpD
VVDLHEEARKGPPQENSARPSEARSVKAITFGRPSRFLISAALIAVVLAVCLRLPHVNITTVALMLVLFIVGIAGEWGSAEALVAAIVGAFGFDYFFLPPLGLGIEAADHWVTLGALLATALATGQLSAQARRRRTEALARRDEMEKLYRFVNALLESRSVGSTMEQVVDRLMEIFDLTGVALYDSASEKILRAGSGADVISDHVMHEVATHGYTVDDTALGFSLVPVRHGDQLCGSIGVSGACMPQPLLGAIAGRIGMALAKFHADEKATHAEVARRSEELKSAVLDALAHEIKSPLNSIKIAVTTLLSERIATKEDRHEMLAIIDEEANRMDGWITNAIQLSYLDAGELRLQMGPHDIGRVISGVLTEMHLLTGDRPIEVRVPKALPLAECDDGMIARVLKQVLENALKYSPAGSPVTVSAEFTGGAIVIGVADRGPGIDPDERERIFEKHYRGRASRSGVSGMGLGLASAKCIMEAHGGEIRTTSPTEGGAAFHITVPVAKEASLWALQES